MVFGITFDDNLKAALVAGKSPLDALNMDTKLGERYSEFKTFLCHELDEARAEASAAARTEMQGEEAENQRDDSGKPIRSGAYKAFLEDVQARVGEIKKEDLLDSIQYYEDKARNLLASNVQMFVFPSSEKELGELLEKTAAAQARGAGKSFVGILCDPAQWGEAITNPHIRVCPLNMQYLKTFLSAVIKNRDNQQLSIHSRDLFIYFDSFLPGNLPKWLGAFQTGAGDTMTKQSFTVFLSYDEDSLMQRRQYVKANTTTFQQIEEMSLVTSESFGDCMTKQNRKHFKGSNFGNKIGDVVLDSPQMLWSMTLKDIGCFFSYFNPSKSSLSSIIDFFVFAGQGHSLWKVPCFCGRSHNWRVREPPGCHRAQVDQSRAGVLAQPPHDFVLGTAEFLQSLRCAGRRRRRRTDGFGCCPAACAVRRSLLD